MRLLTSVLLAMCIALLCTGGGNPEETVKPIFGKTNPTPEQLASGKVKRFASVVELSPEKEQHYRELHADVWPEVVATIKKANVQNYSIFMAEINGKNYLFSYLEYVGDNAEEDFANMAKDTTTKDKWWPETSACQKRLLGTPEGEQWLSAEMLMHFD